MGKRHNCRRCGQPLTRKHDRIWYGQNETWAAHFDCELQARQKERA